MITIAQTIDTALNPLRKIASCIGAPVFDLAARLYVANAFFSSGILRFNDWKNGTFDTQLFLFELELCRAFPQSLQLTARHWAS
jgi:uncharacterized membrane protein YphA (DoxX/SURF4 family)